jgi:hypothetical protein
MIHRIADKILENLVYLPFIDQYTGVVKVAKIISGDTVKTFPIACNTPTDCDPNKLKALVPNSTKRSILYFEDMGTQQTELVNGGYRFQATLRLVCWINYKKISGALCDTSLIATNILKYLPTRLGNFDEFIDVWVEVSSQDPAENVFDRYNYNEERNQFMTYPYDVVAFTLKATWKVLTACVPEIVPKEEIC